MKLEIDLTSREEIDAAVSLLQVLQVNTEAPHACTGSGNCRTHGSPELDADARKLEALVGAGAAGPSFAGTQAEGLAALMAGKTPAEVFTSGFDLPTPLLPGVPAPFTAGAVPSPIVHEVPPAATLTATPSVPLPPAPTPAPAATAPSVSAAPSTPAPAVELDAKGLPWDERIHASSKAKISDGTWRMKKQVDPALVATVEAELRARVAGRQGAAAPEVPLPDGTPKSPDGWPFSAPTAPPVAPLPPAPTVVADPQTFEQLMPRLTAAVEAGVMPATAVGAACAAVGLASVVALQTAPQFVPQVWAALKQQYPSLT